MTGVKCRKVNQYPHVAWWNSGSKSQPCWEHSDWEETFFIQIFKVWCLCLSYISLHLCNILPCTALINLSPLSLTHWTIDTFSTQGLNQRSNTGRQRRAFQISRGCNQAAASHLYHWDRPASYSIYHVFDGGAGHRARLPQSSRGLWSHWFVFLSCCSLWAAASFDCRPPRVLWSWAEYMTPALLLIII